MLWCFLVMHYITLQEYSGLVSGNVPVTSHLFGDDMLKTMQDLKQEASIVKEATTAQWQ